MGADGTHIAVSEAWLTTDDEFLVLVEDVRFRPLPTTTASGIPSITKCSREMKEKGATKGDEEIEVTIGHGELIACAKKDVKEVSQKLHRLLCKFKDMSAREMTV